MRFTYPTVCFLAAGSLTVTLALPVSTSIVESMPPILEKITASMPALTLRQERDSATAISTPAWSPPKPTFVYDPSQPSAVVPSVSYSYTDAPTATVTPQVQNDGTFTHARDKFGSRSFLVVCGVIGVVVLVIIVWTIIAHRNGQRPFACFGGCVARKKDVDAGRCGSWESEIPLFGAGRHYDRRPVSSQPQPFPMPTPQRPKPTQHQIPRRPVAEPEWARQF